MTALAQFDLPDEEATRRLGRSLAGLCRPGDVFALQGDLGTGKTVLARAFVEACEGHDEEVPSPTFTLVQTYDTGRGPLYHFDLYRLERPEDAYELDIEEAFAEGISLIEWPERLGRLLPPAALTVGLAHAGGEARRATLAGTTAWTPRLKEAGLVG